MNLLYEFFKIYTIEFIDITNIVIINTGNFKWLEYHLQHILFIRF